MILIIYERPVADAACAVFREHDREGMVAVNGAELWVLEWSAHSQSSEPRVSSWVLKRDPDEAIVVRCVLPVADNRAFCFESCDGTRDTNRQYNQKWVSK